MPDSDRLIDDGLGGGRVASSLVGVGGVKRRGRNGTGGELEGRRGRGGMK